MEASLSSTRALLTIEDADDDNVDQMDFGRRPYDCVWASALLERARVVVGDRGTGGEDGRSKRKSLPMTDGTKHTVIWLQPWCDGCERNDYSEAGRLWCQDDPWGHCDECGAPAVKYVLAPDQPERRDDGECAPGKEPT